MSLRFFRGRGLGPGQKGPASHLGLGSEKAKAQLFDSGLSGGTLSAQRELLLLVPSERRGKQVFCDASVQSG